MKKIQQMILVLMIVFSIFPISKISAETESTAIQKVLESSHEVLPEGFKLEKYLGDTWNRYDYVAYGESKEIPFVIEVENKSEENVERIFIQEDLSELMDLILEESLGNELSIGGYYMTNTLKSDGVTPIDYSETVQDLIDGIYVDLDKNSSITFKFSLELKEDLNDLEMIENTVLANDMRLTIEVPVKHPEVKVDKQSIAYVGDTPYEEMPEGSDGEAEDGQDEEPTEDEEPIEDFSLLYRGVHPIQDENFRILEKAKAGSKIRYAIVLDNIADMDANDYKIKDISLDKIVPQYAEYVHDQVSVYYDYANSEPFVLKDNPKMEGLSKSKEITIEELKDGAKFNLWEKARIIVVFDIELNEDLPTDLNFIENRVEHLGGEDIERTPIEPPQENPDKPIVEEPDKPIVEEPDKPIVEEPDKPIVEEPGKPNVEEPQKPILEEADTPLVEEVKDTEQEDRLDDQKNDEKKSTEDSHEELTERTGESLPATGMGTYRNVSLTMMFFGFILFALDKFRKD